MGLPEELKFALEKRLAAASFEKIAVAAKRLSERYRSLDRKGSSFMVSEDDYLAYLTTRLPATYGAISQVLALLNANHSIQTFLDIGSGPGTGFWAAREFFPLKQATLIEKEKGLVQLGKSLTDEQEISCAWKQADMEMISFESHDLILMAYSLGEIDKVKRLSVLKKLWEATGQAIAIIEPGTPTGYQTILEARNFFISQGAHLLAPCSHSQQCPLSGSDWCHFYARIERNSLHRRLKEGELNYEDEKFSYIIFTRQPIKNSGSRVIRHPQKGKGYIRFTLCSEGGIESKVISRKQNEFYRVAKKIEWGSLLNLNNSEL